MKDIHNHLLYGLDDGSFSLDSSIEILNNLYNRGVTDIVLTPHYIIGTDYNSNNRKKIELMDELQKNTKVKLYIGNEVYIDNDILKYIDKKEISTINNSKYLLIELPLNEKLSCYKEIIFELIEGGIVPVIAHPERYSYLSINDLEDLIKQGCLFQGNITSLIGKYGINAKRNLKLLLKKNMIHVLGTDIHRNDVDIKECEKRLKSLVDYNIYLDITTRNFDKIINNENVQVYDIKRVGSFFNKEKIR